MPDFSTNNYSQTDALNTKPVPNGMPYSASASTLYPIIRTHMGATKRGFDHLNAMVTAGGTANALALVYEVAPALPHPKGVTFAFWAGATNTGPATLSVNGAGPFPIVDASGAALTAGDIVGEQAYVVRFDGVRFRVALSLTKVQLAAAVADAKNYADTVQALAKVYTDTQDAAGLAAAKAYADAGDATAKTYTDTGDAAGKAYTDAAVAALTGATTGFLKRSGDRMTGALSSAVVDHGTKSSSTTETYDFNAGNTHRVTVSGGTHTINPANLAEGDVLQINILYTSGSIAVSGTTQYELGGGDKGTTLSAVGVTLVSGRAYRMIFEMVGGIRTAFFT